MNTTRIIDIVASLGEVPAELDPSRFSHQDQDTQDDTESDR
jgi:hypothetical protein